MEASELRARMLQAILAQGVPMSQAITDAEAAVAYVLNGAEKPEESAAPDRLDIILDAWAEGVLCKSIARRVGMTSASVFQVVHRARKAGDPRAAARYHFSKAWLANVRARLRARAAIAKATAP